VIEDTIVSVTIEARVYTDEEWRKALAPRWSASVEAMSAGEILLVARRT
jgi:hypothetical protein